MTEEITFVTIVKNAAYIPAIFIGLSAQSYAILAVLMVVDTIFGVLRVGIVHGGEHIRSYRLSAGILSKLTIIGVPLMIAWAGQGVGINLVMVAQGAISMLILAQLYSILGNVYSIRVGKDVQEFDAVSWVLHRLQKTIERLLKDETKHTNILEQTSTPPHETSVAFKKEEDGRALQETSK